MSKTSVRAGEATALIEVVPCPPPTNDFLWDQYVNVQFTDVNGQVSQLGIPFDEQGHWPSSIWMAPPHTRISSYDPLIYADGAALGTGSVRVWCEEEGV